MEIPILSLAKKLFKSDNYGLSEIRDGAFEECSFEQNRQNGIIVLDIPGTVEIIGTNAFSRFYSPLDHNGDYMIPDYHSMDNPKQLILHEGLREIGDEAFQNSSIQSVNFPSTLKKIGDFAFQSNPLITEIQLPYNLKRIGNSAFAATGLKSVNILASVMSIGTGAFASAIGSINNALMHLEGAPVITSIDLEWRTDVAPERVPQFFERRIRWRYCS